MIPPEVLFVSIDELPLTTRAYNGLKLWGGVEEIADLTCMTEIDVLKIPGIGLKTLADIKWSLSYMGLALRPDPHGRVVRRGK